MITNKDTYNYSSRDPTSNTIAIENIENVQTTKRNTTNKLYLAAILTLVYSIAILFYDEFTPSSLLLQRKLVDLNSGKTHAHRGCEGTVMLMRHCEKQSLVTDNEWTHEHCNYIGLLRARFLTTLFGNGTTHRWPTPTNLYALSPQRKHHKISRQIETLTPLSNMTQIPINSNYHKKDSKQLTKSIIQGFKNGTLCDTLTIICWDHGDIPKLAKQLGCTPSNGCPMEYNSITYDEAWQIRYHYNSKKVGWEVFGAVFDFGFDPLMFSKKLGKYNS